jgi:2-oxoisovalerate dehydrogenase E1 component
VSVQTAPQAPARQGRREADKHELLHTMTLIRAFEARLLSLFAEGKLMGTTHTSIGQEGDAACVVAAAEPSDIIVSNHRGHGHYLAHIGDVDGLMAELMGKPSGVVGGIGGSQHLCARDRFYSNGIQGGIAPLAVGLALGEKRQGRKNAVIVYMGDGTMGEGAVYESFNMAALWGAPVLFVLEHNGIAQTTPTHLVQVGEYTERARAFHINAQELQHPTAVEIQAAAFDALSYVRHEQKPFFLLIRTQRLAAHSKGDDPRPKSELDALRVHDPLTMLQAELGQAAMDAAEASAKTAVDAAYAAALATPDAHYPPRRASHVDAGLAPGSAFRNGDAGEIERARASLGAIAGKTVLEQLNQALHRIFAARGHAVLIGEDILDPYGGAFKVTRGLATAYPERVLTSPISELGIVGIGAGMAMRGLRPIVEIMFGDFMALCADQLINHAAKYPIMYNGLAKCPLVVRTPMGGRRGYGPTHSQTLERMFLGTIGLRVLAPSNVHDSGAVLEAAVADDGPVLFVENKLLYAKRLTPDDNGLLDDFEVRYFGGDVPLACLSLTGFSGEAVTLYSYGGMAPYVMEAARTLLMDEEVAVRIVLPAELHPMPRAELAATWAEGSAVLAVEESNADFGFGAEVLATLAESGCTGRGAARLGSRPTCIASARSLEEETLPQPADIVAAVLQLLRRRS